MNIQNLPEVQINGEGHTVVRSVYRELNPTQCRDLIRRLVLSALRAQVFSWPFSGRRTLLTHDEEGIFFKIDMSSPRSEEVSTKRIFVDRVVRCKASDITDPTPRLLEIPRGLRVNGTPQDAATLERLVRSGMKIDDVGTMYLPPGSILVYQTPDGELYESVKGSKGIHLVHIPDPNETQPQEAAEEPQEAHRLFQTVEALTVRPAAR